MPKPRIVKDELFELPSSPSELVKLANKPVFDLRGNRLGPLRRIILSKEDDRPTFVEIEEAEGLKRYPANYLYIFKNRLLLIEGGVREYLKCPKCGSFTPKAERCIYCGHEFVAFKEKTEALKTRELVDPSVKDLVREFAETGERLIKLVSLVAEEKISAETFARLYDEYEAKLGDLTETLKRALKEQRDSLRDIKRSLSRLEEAKSMLASHEYARRKANWERKLLSATLNMEALSTPFLIRESEVPALLDKVRDCLKALPSLKLKPSKRKKVKATLEQLARLLDETTRWKETIRAKLEIGELSREVYEHLSRLGDVLSG